MRTPKLLAILAVVISTGLAQTRKLTSMTLRTVSSITGNESRAGYRTDPFDTSTR